MRWIADVIRVTLAPACRRGGMTCVLDLCVSWETFTPANVLRMT
jgi:hypothetical protein